MRPDSLSWVFTLSCTVLNTDSKKRCFLVMIAFSFLRELLFDL